MFPTLTQPLRSREQMREIVDDEVAWRMLFEQPLSESLEWTFRSDLVRGVVATDALIGTFAAADDPDLRQNRCFLYHVIGNGTGRWDVPVGGMGALSGALSDAARGSGVDDPSRPRGRGRVDPDRRPHGRGRVRGRRHLRRLPRARQRRPAVLARLLGRSGRRRAAPEGSQLKLNMLLSRLPRLRDPAVAPADAFAGTFHVNEGYEQLQRAFEQASRRRDPARAAVRALLPFAHRPEHPVRRAAARPGRTR